MNKWYMHNVESGLENKTLKILWFWEINWSPDIGKTTKFSDTQHKKKINRRRVDFVVPAGHRVKLKESEEK